MRFFPHHAWLACIVMSCQTITIADRSALERSGKAETLDNDGIYYRLPATRYKVVVTGKYVTSTSPYLGKEEEIRALLMYPLPFVREIKSNELVIEQISLVPETVADESTLYAIRFHRKSPFSKLDFKYRTNGLLAPNASETRVEGTAIDFVVGVASTAVSVLVPGGLTQKVGLESAGNLPREVISLIDQYNKIKRTEEELASTKDTPHFEVKMKYWQAEEARVTKALAGSTEEKDYAFTFDWYPTAVQPAIAFVDSGVTYEAILTNVDDTERRRAALSAHTSGNGIFYRVPFMSSCALKASRGGETLFSKAVYLRIPQLGAIVNLPDMKSYRRNQGFAIHPDLGTLESFSLTGAKLSDEQVKAMSNLISTLPDDSAERGINTAELQAANDRMKAIIEQMKLARELEDLQKKP